MKSLRLALGLAVLSALSALAVVHAAGATIFYPRTWVGSTGSDSNACTRSEPCLTWNGAMAKTAPGGEVDAIDPGDFGQISISQSVTIDGGGGQVASILAQDTTDGVYVNAGANGIVTIRNLRIQGTDGSGNQGLFGIHVGGVGSLHIERCVIAGMNDGIIIQASTQPAAGAQIFIEDTTVQDNIYQGIYIAGSSSANVHVTVTGSRMTGNGEYGLYATDYSRVTVQGSQASGNTLAGYIAIANSATTILSMFDSVATNNLAGGVIAGGGGGTSTIRIANMGVFNNVFGYSTGTGGSIVSFGNNNNSGSGTPNASLPQD